MVQGADNDHNDEETAATHDEDQYQIYQQTVNKSTLTKPTRQWCSHIWAQCSGL